MGNSPDVSGKTSFLNSLRANMRAYRSARALHIKSYSGEARCPFEEVDAKSLKLRSARFGNKRRLPKPFEGAQRSSPPDSGGRCGSPEDFMCKSLRERDAGKGERREPNTASSNRSTGRKNTRGRTISHEGSAASS